MIKLSDIDNSIIDPKEVMLIRIDYKQEMIQHRVLRPSKFKRVPFIAIMFKNGKSFSFRYNSIGFLMDDIEKISNKN